MPLTKTSRQIALATGAKAEVDEFALESPAYLIAENVHTTKQGTLVKRSAYEWVGENVSGSTKVPFLNVAARTLYTSTPTGVKALPSGESISNNGPFMHTHAKIASVTDNAETHGYSLAYHPVAKKICLAWVAGRPSLGANAGIYAIIYNEDGSIYEQKFRVSDVTYTSCYHPEVTACGTNTFYISFYSDTPTPKLLWYYYGISGKSGSLAASLTASVVNDIDSTAPASVASGHRFLGTTALDVDAAGFIGTPLTLGNDVSKHSVGDPNSSATWTAYSVLSGTTTLKLDRVGSSGFSAATIVGGLPADTLLLDLEYDSNTDRLLVLYAHTFSTSGCTLVLRVCSATSSATLYAQTSSSIPGPVFRAACGVSPDHSKYGVVYSYFKTTNEDINAGGGSTGVDVRAAYTKALTFSTTLSAAAESATANNVAIASSLFWTHDTSGNLRAPTFAANKIWFPFANNSQANDIGGVGTSQLIFKAAGSYNGTTVLDLKVAHVLWPLAENPYEFYAGVRDTHHISITQDGNDVYLCSRILDAINYGSSEDITSTSARELNNKIPIMFPDRGHTVTAHVSKLDIEAAQIPAIQTGEFGLSGGGFLSLFDGSSTREQTILEAPEIAHVLLPTQYGATYYYEPTYSVTSINPNPLEQTFRFVTQCVYYDSSGRLHRGPMSAPVYVDADKYLTNDREFYCKVGVVLPPTISLSSEELYVELYASSTYSDAFISASPQYRLVNRRKYDPDDAEFLTGTVELEFKVTHHEPHFLYTDVGQLPAITPPNPLHLASTSNRIALISADEPNVIYVSKQLEPGVGVEFAYELRAELVDSTPATGMGFLDEKIIVFQRSKIWVIPNTVPDNYGNRGALSLVNVSNTIGCTSFASIVSIPHGLIFRSDRGMYLLDRSLQTHYIGGAVSRYLEGVDITSASIAPTYGECRFTLTGSPYAAPTSSVADSTVYFPNPRGYQTGDVLVYNYETNDWYLHTDILPSGANPVTSAFFDGTFYMLKSTTEIAAETTNTYIGPGTHDYGIKIYSPWIKIAGTSGGATGHLYNRLYRTQVLGRYYGTNAATGYTYAGYPALDGSALSVEQFVDYRPESNQTSVFEPDTFFAANAQEMLVRVNPKTQKCSAVRYVLSEVRPADVYVDGATTYSFLRGRGFEISSLGLELGVQQNFILNRRTNTNTTR